MKTFFKVVGLVLLVIVALAGIGVSYLSLRKPAQRAASQTKVELTPERVARGEYLVHHVGACFDCHSERDQKAYALPFKPGREGVGGFVWDKRIGFPGTLVAANLTPDPATGLGSWTDGEIIRAIREGVDRDGNALFPIMPYTHLRNMSDDDVQAIVAYLRTLKPQRWDAPKKSLDVPLNFIVKFIPEPVEGPVAAPNRNDTIAYGKYLTQIASCQECHTPKDDKGNQLPGQDFAGGFEMHTPDFKVTTANITPHPNNWVGQVSKEQFIARFRSFASYAPAAAQKNRNTLMPWISYSGMSDQDLGAIYDYLKTVKPIDKKIDPWG